MWYKDVCAVLPVSIVTMDQGQVRTPSQRLFNPSPRRRRLAYKIHVRTLLCGTRHPARRSAGACARTVASHSFASRASHAATRARPTWADTQAQRWSTAGLTRPLRCAAFAAWRASAVRSFLPPFGCLLVPALVSFPPPGSPYVFSPNFLCAGQAATPKAGASIQLRHHVGFRR